MHALVWPTSRRTCNDTARAAGLNPPRTFGTEVVARFLGLRTNHPFADDALELYPWEPITRAEAAHSLRRACTVATGRRSTSASSCSRFSLPALRRETRRALRVAVSKIGMPYIWGGETDRKSSDYGYQAHGGYDCSGFVWRVFKLSGHAGGRAHRRPHRRADGGRDPQVASAAASTTCRPGDLVFFGRASFDAKATERGVDHVGIALSEHWMIHASAQGVYVSSLDEEWRRDALHLGATRALRTFTFSRFGNKACVP